MFDTVRADLVDVKNGLSPRRLTRWLYPRGVVFVHVPKCAGTSVSEAIRRHYRLSRLLIDPGISFNAAAQAAGEPVEDWNRHRILGAASEIRRAALHYGLAGGYACVTGHAPLGPGTLRAWQASHAFVTVLRHPVERYLSHLAQNYAQPQSHGGITLPLERFLETPRARIMGALYPKYFAGMPMDGELWGKGAVAAAKKTLSALSLIGFTEDLPGFGTRLSACLGRKIEIEILNRRTTPPLEVPRPVWQRIETLCAPDLEIYEWARLSHPACL